MPGTPRDPEVIVVGSGPSGALAARLLADAGVRVLVIEAGDGSKPRRAADAPQRDEGEAVGEGDARWRWRATGMPAEWLRVRRPGGRSRVWGGWFSPCPANTFRHDAQEGSPWPFAPLTLVRLQRAVGTRLRALGATIRSDDETAGDAALRARLTGELGVPAQVRRTMTVGQRPLCALDLLGPVPVRTGSIAVRLALRRGEEVVGVVVCNSEGHASLLPCGQVILAASAIETTRILLETARVGRFDVHPGVGRGLVDHLVVGRLVVLPGESSRVSAAPALCIPRFVNVRGRSRDYPGGFSVEVSRPVGMEALPTPLRAELSASCGGRDPATLGVRTIHAIGQMFPRAGRDVGILPAERDALGRPIPHVRLLLHDEERRMLDDMEETCDAVAGVIAGDGAIALSTSSPRETFLLGHEAGTCVMGASPDHPVDLRGRVRGLRGVRIVDGSLMPTATDRHPTAALLALTLVVTSCLLRDLRGLNRR